MFLSVFLFVDYEKLTAIDSDKRLISEKAMTDMNAEARHFMNNERNLKKRIAVFANVWSERILSTALEGLQKAAQEADYDVFAFLSQAAPGMDEAEQREEKRMYQLPNLEDFDGVILLSHTLNFNDLIDELCQRAKEAKVPVVSTGIKIEGAAYVGMDNRTSMLELVEHLVTIHNVKDIEFIAGLEGNDSSDQRVQCVRDVLAKYGIEFLEDHVHYSDWSIAGARKIAEEILENRKGNYPDAFICANDGLALATCEAIEKVGLRIPEDIIVTGHDFIYDGQVFYPSLCSIEQDDYEVGKTSFDSLLKMINGEKVEDVLVPNHFVANQSCGCHSDKSESILMYDRKHRYHENMSQLEFAWSNGWVTRAVVGSNNVEEIKEKLDDFFQKSGMFAEGTTYILEDKNAQLYFAEKHDSKERKGYSEELDVIVAVENHKPIGVSSIQRRELIPGYHKIPGKSKFYMFVPVHFIDWVFGYAVLENWIVGISSRKVVTFANNFNMTIDKLKQNISLARLNGQLKDLYTKDSLTGMYNRFGFNSEGFKIYNDCKQNAKHMMLMFIDINRMKLINDYYGHLQGDMALKNVAEVIKNMVKKDWISIRFGGDEFLVIGECDSETEIKTIRDGITEEVKKRGQEQGFPFYLSVSCGYLYFCPDAERTLDSYIKQADEAMYEIKAYMHSSDLELREFENRCRDGIS